ncbi:MAG TPA: SRPBCC domain-containing protein [Chryseosolibacter sp.]
MKRAPVIIERTLRAPIEKVWKALTDKDQMRHWYFDLPEFRAEPGFEFTFEGGEEGRLFSHVCRVTEVIPNRKLAYTWRYDGYPGDSTVTFDLFAEGDGTRIRLTHEGLESFPALPDFARENFVTGWTSLIGTSLKSYTEQRS